MPGTVCMVRDIQITKTFFSEHINPDTRGEEGIRINTINNSYSLRTYWCKL